jgi:hypothetical protein
MPEVRAGAEESEGKAKMTWYDLVRKYFPDADDEFCEFVLWEKTCFPVCGPEKVEKQLKELAEKKKDDDDD